MSFHVPENFRTLIGVPDQYRLPGTNNGAFLCPSVISGRTLFVLASDGTAWARTNMPYPAWEHVSVHCRISKKLYTPTWREMCYVKDLFWDPEDVAIQFHPRKSEYVNCHPHTLHLWRPIGVEIPTPPTVTI